LRVRQATSSSSPARRARSCSFLRRTRRSTSLWCAPPGATARSLERGHPPRRRGTRRTAASPSTPTWRGLRGSRAQVATGTGIAPYRSFIRRLFVEKTPFGQAYTGLAWLFLGVANSDALLYDDEWQAVLKEYPDNFKLDYALSREQTNVDGGKMYIQDKVKEYADEVFDKMDSGAVRARTPAPASGAEQARSATVLAGCSLSVCTRFCASCRGVCVFARRLGRSAETRPCLLCVWSAHVLLRPQGHDAGHHGHARGGVRQEGPQLRGEAQGVEEGGPGTRLT
jgi:hypothetical protein